MMLILVDHAFMMLKDAWDSNMLGDNQRTIRKQNANTRNQTKTKREIANGQSFASKRVSLSTFWTRKPKFEVFRQTCSGTIRRQFGDKMQTLETKRKCFANSGQPNKQNLIWGQFGDNNIKTKRKRNANFFVKLARGQSGDNSGTKCKR